MVDPVLYSFRRCPYAMRARWALAVSGVRYELREVRLADKPEAMLSISPKGTVPVLQTADGAVIDESLSIMRWALKSHDTQNWLAGDDPALIASNDGVFKYHLDRYKYPDRHGSDPTEHRRLGLLFLDELEQRIGAAGQLGGVKMGLADAAIVPFVRQFAAVDRDWFDAQPLPWLKTWLAGHLASDLFERIMYRVAPWRPGERVVVLHGRVFAGPPPAVDQSGEELTGTVTGGSAKRRRK
ncbi:MULTISPECIES: glutathione S-transferase [unclassified Sphingomonas]|uniref:glutathione S-transferase n=1 Tax=unclassified Sphingomonas TaxID=196159 RepID=UPI0009EAEC08|nr:MULTISPECIES: glutathione S-transferase [unclassified Sphingomonas]